MGNRGVGWGIRGMRGSWGGRWVGGGGDEWVGRGGGE